MGVAQKKDRLALERVQLSVARAILHRSRRSMSNRDVLAEIGWPTLAWGRRRFKLLMLWQLLHGQSPPVLQHVAEDTAAARVGYNLRNQLSVEPLLCRSRRRTQSFLPSSILWWNELPLHVSSSTTLRSFVSKLDSHFSSSRFSFGLS